MTLAEVTHVVILDLDTLGGVEFGHLGCDHPEVLLDEGSPY